MDSHPTERIPPTLAPGRDHPRQDHGRQPDLGRGEDDCDHVQVRAFTS